MRKIIQNLRKQPEDVRVKILHLSTAVCAVVLVLLWALSIGNSFNSLDSRTQTSNAIEPFSAIKDNFLGGFNSIREEASGLRVAE